MFGVVQAAQDFIQIALSIKRTDVSFPLVNLGLAYWFTNQLEEASKTLLEGLRHREDAYGVDDKESFMCVLVVPSMATV